MNRRQALQRLGVFPAAVATLVGQLTEKTSEADLGKVVGGNALRILGQVLQT